MFKGFSERLSKEIIDKVPKTTEVKVFDTFDKRYAAWNGGA